MPQLRVIFAIYRRYDASINPEQIHEELAARLREELDYGREARHMALYPDMLRPTSRMCTCRRSVPELSTRPPAHHDLARRPAAAQLQGGAQEQRDRLALNMFRAWYVPFYDYGVIHGDPHLGNYSVRPDLDINLLDFGCIRVFPPKFVQGVIDLYWALATGDRELAVHAYETWGFSGLSQAR